MSGAWGWFVAAFVIGGVLGAVVAWLFVRARAMRRCRG